MSELLDSLYPIDLRENERIVIWSDKRTTWCPTVRLAARTSEALAPQADVYFGVCLQDMGLAMAAEKQRSGSPYPNPRLFRGGEASACGIGGLWLDVDIAGPGHAKEGLPDEQTAREFVDGLDPRPTMVLETGGGCHVWWILTAPERLPDDAARAVAKRAVMGFQRAMESRAGFTIDPTADLARVLRLDGSQNHKGGLAVPVHVATRGGPRYEWRDMVERFALPPDAVSPPVGASEAIDIAGLPPVSLEARAFMADNVPGFQDAWDRRKGFSSQSEYDLSLASYCVQYPDLWPDEKIAALLVMHRRLGGTEKPARPDYLARTIAKARSRREGDAVLSEARVITEYGVEPGDKGLDGGLRSVSVGMGIDIVGIEKLEGRWNRYTLVLADGGRCILGEIDAISSATKTRNRLRDMTPARHMSPRVTPREWPALLQTLLDAAEVVDVGVELSLSAEVQEQVDSYLAREAPLSAKPDTKGALSDPFVHDGMIWVDLSAFRAFAGKGLGLSRQALATELRAMSVERRTIAVEIDGRRTSISRWGISRERS